MWIPRTLSSGSKVTSFIRLLRLYSGLSVREYTIGLNTVLYTLILSYPNFFTASASVNPTDPIGGLVNTTEGTVSKSAKRSVLPLKSHSAKTLPARIATGVKAF